MDELIVKLGYLDYRDFLAVNKYIIDNKLHSENQNTVRQKILQTAIQKLKTDEGKEIVKEAWDNLEKTGGENLDEKKLQVIFKHNPEAKIEY